MSIVGTLGWFRDGEIEIKPPRTFDVAVILGGNIRLFNGKYISSSYEENTDKGVGGRGRVVTAAIFYHLGLASDFIVSTGKTHPNSDAPTEAAVMKTELIDYGVPDSCITLEEKSVNTLENAIEVARILRTDKFKQATAIALVSNSYHLRRMYTFFDAQGLTAEGRHLTLISCDRIMYEILPELRQFIIDLYNSPSMKARMKGEAQGVIDFYAGGYEPRPLH
jgi:vancomycin permeability regulator SanA